MSSKHYFPETAVNTLVPRALKALVAANPSLALIESERVVFNTNHDESIVAVISGGGSGHEPSWSAYVGDGLLASVACGDIFASPSMKQVLSAIASSPSRKGTILLITNYTGDNLHFGLAAERALAVGLTPKVTVLPATDDVSIGKSKSGKVGRRGLAGNSITMKAIGAAAARNFGFEQCVEIGKAVNSQLATIGSALDHCHVPGRQNHESIPDDTCIAGAGIHNEPGAQRLTPFPSVEDLIDHLLKLVCDPNDPERGYVKFGDNDDVVLFINNYGGISNLELGALTQEIIEQLDAKWHIKPVKIYAGTFESSLNGPGFCVTLCNISTAATACKLSSSELLDLLSDPTAAPAWPNVLSNTSTKVTGKVIQRNNNVSTRPKISSSEDILEAFYLVDPSLLDRVVRQGCVKAIAAELSLTKWDMVMGDGDCGEAVFGVSTDIIKLLDSGVAKTGSIFDVLYSIIDAVDNMGGTLGAIFGIFLAALATSLRTSSTQSLSNPAPPSSQGYARAIGQATEKLKNYTGAREGDRTVMDVLLPFAAAFESSADFGKAVAVAKEKAEATRYLKPKFGRASYVGKGGKEQELPDPGAWALMEMLSGMLEGID
ncbi:Dihydroxyacetone kinase [Lachnellula hyalina]|uniref:Dihydroxyacetone kinase n=1 Tax=Lachnellula hyalina TaxID=1316788 RepID=A0A8H8R0L1_9HELO|nr:Dihydroxyacetone kinase [Lachnellula hyalina]TVY26238.1 Dihydroxyacetone kinase [Lachnellula hyalina]